MIDRIEGNGNGVEHMAGVTPTYADLHWDGLDFSAAQFDAVTSIDSQSWRDELALHQELFDKLSHNLPPALVDTKASWSAKL